MPTQYIDNLFLNQILDPNNSVLVSCSCYNKLSQAWWLKTTEIYSLQFWKSKYKVSITGAKSRCQQVYIPFRDPRGESIPCNFEPMGAGIPWLVAASVQSQKPKPSIFKSISAQLPVAFSPPCVKSLSSSLS